MPRLTKIKNPHHPASHGLKVAMSSRHRAGSDSSTMASKAPQPLHNHWEARALDHVHADSTRSQPGSSQAPSDPRTQDPLIFPGLYCPSGFDLMAILMQVRFRPNPEIDLGAIDCSVALTLCDLEAPDSPIVYVSDAFCELTGYSRDEVIGWNCRFLQSPNGMAAVPRPSTNQPAARRMSQAIQMNQEIQIQVTNYKKDGQPFSNILSIIPIELGPYNHRYAVGLQCEV